MVQVKQNKKAMLLITALMGPLAPSIGSAQTTDRIKKEYGCVQIDVKIAEPNFELSDSWQNWCDLNPEQPEAVCFDWIKEAWVKRRSFPQEHILARRKAGQGTCPSVPNAPPPTIRD